MGSRMLLMGKHVEDSEKVATRHELRKLVDRQGYKCSLSGAELSPSVAELDHVVSVADGGWHGVDNLQVLHKVVNRMKGTMGNDEFIQWCRLVADHAEDK